ERGRRDRDERAGDRRGSGTDNAPGDGQPLVAPVSDPRDPPPRPALMTRRPVAVAGGLDAPDPPVPARPDDRHIGAHTRPGAPGRQQRKGVVYVDGVRADTVEIGYEPPTGRWRPGHLGGLPQLAGPSGRDSCVVGDLVGVNVDAGV